MSILQAIGYRTHGKDTLFKQLNGISDILFNWTVYGRNVSTATPFTIRPNGYKRLAFADGVKEVIESDPEVQHVMTLFDLEGNKEMPFGESRRSFRDRCIDMGMKRRAEDPDYWIKRVLRQIQPTDHVIITDCRFPNEVKSLRAFALERGMDFTTCRVYHTDKPIPPAGIESEHSLDDTATDYLLVREPSDIISAVNLWPQYKDYVFIKRD